LYLGRTMLAHGEAWQQDLESRSTPEAQQELLRKGLPPLGSKVRNTTDPLFIGCFVTAMLGLICLGSAWQDHRRREAQQSSAGDVTNRASPEK
jgi:hypothetical protein